MSSLSEKQFSEAFNAQANAFSDSKSSQLTQLQANLFSSNPFLKQDIAAPLLGLDLYTSPNLLYVNMMREQSQKIILRSLNQSLYQELQKLLSDLSVLRENIKKCEEKRALIASTKEVPKIQKKKKRERRLATQIIRLFKCPDSSCSKSYGSEFSLTQHLKTKHADKCDCLLDQMNQATQA